MSKINGIDVIYYFVHDFERAKAFYSYMIGAEPDGAPTGGFCEWTLPRGETFGIIKGQTHRPGNGVIFNVDDVAASVIDLKAHGVEFEDDGELEETPVCYLAFAADSEGNTFMLHQRK